MTMINRRSFLKGTAGAAALGLLRVPLSFAEAEEVKAAAAFGAFTPGTYTSVQATPYAEIAVKCVFTDKALTDVTYEVLQSAKGDYFAPLAGPMQKVCQNIVEAGTTEGVDGISGATFCSDAIKVGVSECAAQALGIKLNKKVNEVPQKTGWDTFSGDLSAVFSPVQLGSMTLPNRVIRAAGSGLWADAQGDSIAPGIEKYGAMAANGVSLILAAGSILRNVGFNPEKLEIKDMTEDEALAKAKTLVDAIHDNGGKFGIQICFGGGAPTYPDEFINDKPVEEIDAYIDRLGVISERAKKIGIDCFEIKGASGDALNGFLTRRVNRREDEYGPQSIENRTRLFRRMIEKIKEVNGADFPVGALINAVEENDLNLGQNELFMTIEETREIAKALEGAGADWIQVRVGANGQEMNIWAPDVQHCLEGEDGITGFGTKFNYEEHFDGLVDGSMSGFASFLPCVKAIKEAVSVPVGCAADMDLRLGPDFLNAAVAAGETDLIFMNRPLRADYELVRKLQEGRREDIRPCMKCMHCHASGGTVYPGTAIGCRVNATHKCSLTADMPEGRIPTSAANPKQVVVIGAGPSGMEAALIAAQRGHKVALYDSADKLGGRMQFARGVKGDHERFEDLFHYYEVQLEKAGVEIHLRSKMTADAIKDLAPDAVIVATGAVYASELQSTAGVQVVTPEAAFSPSFAGKKIAMIGAHVQACDFAAYLVSHGKTVHIINPLDSFYYDKGQGHWFRDYMRAYMVEKGTKIRHNATVKGVADNGLMIVSDCGMDTLIKCDTVIDFSLVSNNALVDELTALGIDAVAVGDALDIHNIQNGILTGNLAGRRV